MTNDRRVDVDVQVACDNQELEELPDHETIVRWVTAALSASDEAQRIADEVSVRIVARDEMQRLNRDYCGQDKPTNVLSFPAGVVDGLPVNEVCLLGDIIVCAAIVRDEAAQQDKKLADHWAHMLVHGTLHLQGFDHQSESDASVMEALEVKILAAQGIADPYGAL